MRKVTADDMHLAAEEAWADTYREVIDILEENGLFREIRAAASIGKTDITVNTDSVLMYGVTTETVRLTLKHLGYLVRNVFAEDYYLKSLEISWER